MAQATIYFTEESATLQPMSTPLMRDLLERVAACRAAGGELRGIEIVPFPDAGSDRQMAQVQIEERGRRVSAALVELGAPAEAIRVRAGRTRRGEMMSRRAEVNVDLW